MPVSVAVSRPLALVWGEDEFSVKRRARQIFQQWTGETGGWDHDVIDACVANSGEALRVIAKLRDSLQALPLFGSSKVAWLQNCNFLGEEPALATQSVSEVLAELAREWRSFSWNNVRLLISAGKVDKRRVFYKTIEALGLVEDYPGWSTEDPEWQAKAEIWAENELKAAGKGITIEALAELVAMVGPSPRQLSNEIEKLALYIGDRREVQAPDVRAIVTRNKQADAFALGDAFGDRNLPRVLRVLDQELWELKLDRQKSPIRLLYGLIAKVRVLIFLKEMAGIGRLKPGMSYSRFKEQLQGLPSNLMPEDKRLNPLAMHPYVLFKALPQATKFSLAELVRAMELLLECNQRLIYSGLDDALVLQQTLVQILNSKN
ncbi:MAG: DNA polymerase III subunit delta [Candidatus Omnitrophica bacterium]|nr:DNA polymerase III subunit delta [Candidatus Omnitrophota bacterium]